MRINQYIKEFIKGKLFNNKWSEIISAPGFIADNFLKFSGKDYKQVRLNWTIKNSLVLKNNEAIESEPVVLGNKTAVLSFAAGILDELPIRVRRGNWGICLNVKTDSGSKEFDFTLPINAERNYKIHKTGFGYDWSYFHLSLEEFSGKKVILEFKVYFVDTKNKFEKTDIAKHYFVIGSPQILEKKNKNARRLIVLFSVDGMGYKDLFCRKYNIKDIPTPNIDKFLSQACNYKMAYAQGDWSLTSGMSMLTGLFSTQHLVADPRPHPLEGKPCCLSEKIETLPALLKREGFLSLAAAVQHRFSPLYAFSRGFDSYINITRKPENALLNVPFAIRVLEAFDFADLFLFLHVDNLHDPMIRQGSIQMLNSCELRSVIKACQEDNLAELYREELMYLDIQFGLLISYLKDTGQFDNAFVIFTSDHGASFPPGWEKKQENSLYEQRIRVPFAVKKPFQENIPGSQITEPTNASVQVMRSIVDYFKLSTPDYFSSSIQADGLLKGLAVSETIMQPEENDYAITLISKDYKYIMFAEFDWNRRTLLKIKDELLYPVTREGNNDYVNEDDEIGKDNPEILKEHRKIALDFVSQNLKFNKDYPVVCSEDVSKEWKFNLKHP